MRWKIVAILVCMLMISSMAGALSSINTSTKMLDIEPQPAENSYSHDILGEFFTLTTCVPCKYSHRALIKKAKVTRSSPTPVGGMSLSSCPP